MSEAKLQKACIRWLAYTYKHLGLVAASFPNEGRRSYAEAVRLKQMGLTPGMPDLAIFWKGKTIFIEFKYGRNKPKQRQEQTHKLLRAQGFEVVVVYDLDTFIAKIKEFVNQ